MVTLYFVVKYSIISTESNLFNPVVKLYNILFYGDQEVRHSSPCQTSAQWLQTALLSKTDAAYRSIKPILNSTKHFSIKIKYDFLSFITVMTADLQIHINCMSRHRIYWPTWLQKNAKIQFILVVCHKDRAEDS